MPPQIGRRASAIKSRPRLYDTTPELIEALGETYVRAGRKGLREYCLRNRIHIPLAAIVGRLAYYGYLRKGRKDRSTPYSRLERLHKLQQLLNNNTTISDCARLLNTTAPTIIKTIQKYNLTLPNGENPRELHIRQRNLAHDRYIASRFLAEYNTIKIAHPFAILADLHYPYTNWPFITRVINNLTAWGGSEVLLLGEVIHNYNTIIRGQVKTNSRPIEEIDAALSDIADTFYIMGVDIIHRFPGPKESAKRTLDHHANGIRLINGESVWYTRNSPQQAYVGLTGIKGVIERYNANIILGYTHIQRTYHYPYGPYSVIQLGSTAAEHRLPEPCVYTQSAAGALQRPTNTALILIPEGDTITPIQLDESMPLERMHGLYHPTEFAR